MKVILMHGTNTHPQDKWYPWFSDQLKEEGHEVLVPELPDSRNPDFDKWLQVLKELKPDDDTFLVGHSRGGVVILRFLETLPAGLNVKKVILIATNSGSLKYRNGSANGFYTEKGYDFEKIKLHCDNFVVFHSKDDPWVSFEQGIENSDGLEAKFITFKDKKHFGVNDGNIPGLIEEIK